MAETEKLLKEFFHNAIIPRRDSPDVRNNPPESAFWLVNTWLKVVEILFQSRSEPSAQRQQCQQSTKLVTIDLAAQASSDPAVAQYRVPAIRVKVHAATGQPPVGVDHDTGPLLPRQPHQFPPRRPSTAACAHPGHLGHTGSLAGAWLEPGHVTHPGSESQRGGYSAVSGRMSIRQPVRRAASRAFCPSRPIASESW